MLDLIHKHIDTSFSSMYGKKVNKYVLIDDEGVHVYENDIKVAVFPTLLEAVRYLNPDMAIGVIHAAE